MEKGRNIIINQTLHGYHNGHTLLASSVELSQEVKRSMLAISDMSGGSMLSGFETYITGYPLKDANVYALAKTWYAHEMKRPGCVWTQTLLISFGDLPAVNDFDLILSLFKRPNIEDLDLNHYNNTLNYLPIFDIPEGIDSDLSFNNRVLIKSIISNIYDNKAKCVLVQSQSTSNFENIFLSIWGQQWPRLRRNFSFCTGAITPRAFLNELLDLQVVPYKLDARFVADKNICVINPLDNKEGSSSKWLELTYEHLLSPSPILFSFLYFFGSDLTTNRKAFKTLVETYLYFLDAKPDISACIKYLSVQYPLSSEAKSLKNAIFGEIASNFNYILPQYEESTVLYYFSINNSFKTFDYAKLNFIQRFLNLFDQISKNSIQFLQGLIKEDLNPYGEEAMTCLATYLEKKDKLDMLWKDKSLLLVFITLNPSLTYNKDFWTTNVSNQTEIINGLKNATTSTKIKWQIIIKNLIEINSNIDPKVFKEFNPDIEHLVLDWINKDQSEGLGSNWLEYLYIDPTKSLEWLYKQKNIQDRTVQILVRILDPNWPNVVQYGLDPWIRYLAKFVDQELYDVPIEVHCFCITIALNSDDEQAKKLIEKSFEFIYFAIATENLAYSLWRNLEVHTKPLSLWKNWDKCKKFLNAVVDHYIENRWPVKSLLAVLHSKELRDRTATQFKKRD